MQMVGADSNSRVQSCISAARLTLATPYLTSLVMRECVLGGSMRATLFFLTITLVIVTSPASAQSTAVFAAAKDADINASCRIPFAALQDPKTGKSFAISALLNENARLAENLRHRYIVADLNSTDENGNCRGVQEYFTPVGELSEFPRLRAIAAARKTDVASLAKESVEALAASEESPGDSAELALELEDLQNYLQQVQRYKTDPVVKPSVVHGYCVGQTLSLCELVDGQPKLVYRFVTSSLRNGPPPLYRYYSPINVISSRNWSSDRRYSPADARRDTRMGGGYGRIVSFLNGGNPIEMPNFMHFVPAAGYSGLSGNGIHQIAGGLDSGGTFGAPVSLGCIRLNKFQSKLARWWTPSEAKFFVYFESHRYRAFGDAASGRAKGFRAPQDADIEIAAAPPRPAHRIVSTRATNTFAPFGFFYFARTLAR